MKQAIVCAYRLPDGRRIEEALQIDSSSKWAVRNVYRECMNRSGKMEDEPSPSGRSGEFLARCRFATAEEAYAVWEAAQP